MGTPLGWLERVPTYKDQMEKLQGPRPRDLRLPRLPAAAGRRHPDLQGRLRAGGRGPGAARRAHARGGAPLQPPLRRQARRPRRRALVKPVLVEPQPLLTSLRPAAGPRRPEDEQELRQRHRPGRRRRGGAQEGDEHVHGPEADPGRHPGHRRGQPRVHSITTPSTRTSRKSRTSSRATAGARWATSR